MPRWRAAHQLIAIDANNNPASANQCSESMPSCAINQPPLPAPNAWPAYMAEVFSAMNPMPALVQCPPTAPAGPSWKKNSPAPKG